MAPGGYGARPSWWNSIAGTFRKSLDFSGRSTRTEWLLYHLASTFVSAVVSILFPISISDQGEFTQSAWRWLIDGPILLPFPALFVRRLHDQDKSGWWSLLLFALIIGSVVFGEDFPGQTEQSIWLVLPIGILLVTLLILSFWHGSDGENRFGPDPRVEGVA